MPMDFTWNEDKRQSNIDKHGIDFVDAAAIWRGDCFDPFAERTVEGEHRAVALGFGLRRDFLIAVVYTVRDNDIRIISARRARRYERQEYDDRFGTGRYGRQD